MSVNIRIRNGMMPDGEGNGGVSEGDLRGAISDLVKSEGVVDVFAGQLLVHEAASPAMSVVVDAGIGYIPNTSFDENDSDSIKFWEAVVAGLTAERTLVIAANSSGQSRVDLVCLKIDPGASPDYYADDIAELIIVQGTPGAGAPATPAYHLKLAEVTVINGATEIENADITDSRIQVSFANEFKRTIISIASSATITPNVDIADFYGVTALATGATFGVPTGTPRDGQSLILRIKDNGTARALTWNAIFRAIDCVLPTTTVIGKLIYVTCLYNYADTKWDVVSVLQQY